ncbi:MAG: hypothetical protein NVV67_15845 [Pseudoxanthomonas sp.]|nr:hypothetical protein [Pseudoxanthomonas sp.]
MNTRQNKWKAIVGGALLGLLASSASGQWLPTHSTVEATQAKTVFSTERRLILPEGKVLVLPAAGDEISLRDARAKTSRAWAIPEVRRGASMTLLPSGRVLIWGGQDRTGNLQPGEF